MNTRTSTRTHKLDSRNGDLQNMEAYNRLREIKDETQGEENGNR